MNELLISVIVPCYNEGIVLKKSVDEIIKNLTSFTDKFEIILIEDGSEDDTFKVIQEIVEANESVRYLRFVRNFGKESAIHAGLINSKGKAVVIMDADLQHPPELLKRFYDYWKTGEFKIIEAVKKYNSKGNAISKLISRLFNYFMLKLSGLKMEGASDYKFMDRVVVDEILNMPERNRFFRGLVKWTGYKTKQIFFEVPPRIGGESKWSKLSLFKLSISAISSFSNIPLYITTSLGIFTLVFSFGLSIHTLYNKFFGVAVSGFTTVIIIILLLSSLIMISLGVIGIYISNIYLELKHRPYFIISEENIEKGN